MPAATMVGRTFAPATGRPSRSAIVPSIGTSSLASRSTAGLPDVPSPASLHAGPKPGASAITWILRRASNQSGIGCNSERATGERESAVGAGGRPGPLFGLAHRRAAGDTPAPRPSAARPGRAPGHSPRSGHSRLSFGSSAAARIPAATSTGRAIAAAVIPAAKCRSRRLIVDLLGRGGFSRLSGRDRPAYAGSHRSARTGARGRWPARFDLARRDRPGR